jgi:hypothetical protein
MMKTSMVLAILVGALASTAAATAASPPGPITMDESRRLSDQALVQRVLTLFDAAPATVDARPGGYAVLAQEVVQVHRPAGVMMPGGYAVGFNYLGLVLRAHPSKASPGLCEQTRLDLNFEDVARPESGLDGLNINAPKRPAGTEATTAYVPISALEGARPRVAHCADLRNDSGAIEAPDARTAWTGLHLTIQAKALAASSKALWLSCLDEKGAACRKTFAAARAAQVFSVVACEPDDDRPALAAGEVCLSVTGARQRGPMYGNGWRAEIVYRPGPKPIIRRVRMEPWGFIV